MEPSEEIKKLLQEIRDTQKEHLALSREFAKRSRKAIRIQKIALVLVFVSLILIGLVCWMVYFPYSLFLPP